MILPPNLKLPLGRILSKVSTKLVWLWNVAENKNDPFFLKTGTFQPLIESHVHSHEIHVHSHKSHVHSQKTTPFSCLCGHWSGMFKHCKLECPPCQSLIALGFLYEWKVFNRNKYIGIKHMFFFLLSVTLISLLGTATYMLIILKNVGGVYVQINLF